MLGAAAHRASAYAAGRSSGLQVRVHVCVFYASQRLASCGKQANGELTLCCAASF